VLGVFVLLVGQPVLAGFTRDPAEQQEGDLPAGWSGSAEKGSLGSILAGSFEGGKGLEPRVMLWRYWKAFTELLLPAELGALLDLLLLARGIYLYACQQQTTGKPRLLHASSRRH
jgi:hypothetical protein